VTVLFQKVYEPFDIRSKRHVERIDKLPDLTKNDDIHTLNAAASAFCGYENDMPEETRTSRKIESIDVSLRINIFSLR